MLAEHDAIKREVTSLRETLEETQRSSISPPNGHAHHAHGQAGEHHEGQQHHSAFEEGDEDVHDDDDVRSIATIVPHELERVEEEDEEAAALAEAAEDEERRRRREELGRPRTPEPTGMGMEDDEHEHRAARRRSAGFTEISLNRASSPKHDDMTDRLATLASQLETALELSRALQSQHAQAQDTINVLQEKVAALEGRAQATEERVETHSETIEVLRTAPLVGSADTAERESLTEMVTEWKKNVEGRWGGVQEAWESERDRLRKASDEWERRAREVETSVQGAVGRLDAGLKRIDSWAREHAVTNGDAKPGHGLVTPPSPRSLSSHSSRSRNRRRRSRSASRGRSSSRSGSSGETTGASDVLADSGASEGASSLATSFSESPKRASMPKWGGLPDDDDDDSDVPPAYRPDSTATAPKAEKLRAKSPGQQFPLTPKPSFDVRGDLSKQNGDAAAKRRSPDGVSSLGIVLSLRLTIILLQNIGQYTAAVGIVMLSVAAAAVVYRVKPEFSS